MEGDLLAPQTDGGAASNERPRVQSLDVAIVWWLFWLSYNGGRFLVPVRSFLFARYTWASLIGM